MGTVERIYGEIGRSVRRARERCGMTQDDLAQRIGLTRTSITNLERGRQKIQVHTLYALADALQVSVTALLPPSAPPEGDDLSERLPPDLQPAERAWVRRILVTEGDARDESDTEAGTGRRDSTPRARGDS